MSRRILLVDDDPAILATLQRFFETRQWSVATAPDALAALSSFEADRPDVVLLDVNLPGISGMDVLRVLITRAPDAVVVMLSGHGDIDMAVEAMQIGADSFLTKPVAFDQLGAVTNKAFERADLRRRVNRLSESQPDKTALGSLGSSPAMQEVGRQVELLAQGNAPILLTGETGTGKGWIAKIIHALSPRAARPFVAVNCAGLTATFLDTELFGHERGAFTDAKVAKQGLFEVADGGTLFLDEIGDLASELQPKLLTVLETQRFRRLGGTREIEVDVRLLAATHKDLAAEVKAGRFREDLYYRLAVLPLALPALRDRGPSEIAELSVGLLRELRNRVGRGPKRLNDAAIAALTRYDWPGNIRELKNVLERALLLAGDAEELQVRHLPTDVRAVGKLARPVERAEEISLEAVTKRHIQRLLEQFGGNRRRTAAALGITRSTLYKRLREYGIDDAATG